MFDDWKCLVEFAIAIPRVDKFLISLKGLFLSRNALSWKESFVREFSHLQETSSYESQ